MRFMNNLVSYKSVILKCDGTSFDRRTCDIILNGKAISAILVKSGYAWDYELSKGKYAQEQAETFALKQGFGKMQHQSVRIVGAGQINQCVM